MQRWRRELDVASERSWFCSGRGGFGSVRRRRGGCSGFKSGRRQSRRAFRAATAFLNFNFGEEHRGSRGGHGNLPGFGAADSVENLRGVAGEDDVVQGEQRRADDVHTADKFVGAAISINTKKQHPN